MAPDWPSRPHPAQSASEYDPLVRYRRADGILHQVVDGRAMLISPAGDEVLTLNGTGSAVWDALADGGDVESLAATAFHPAEDAYEAPAIEEREPIDSPLTAVVGSGPVGV
jgi:hypothetical protein